MFSGLLLGGLSRPTGNGDRDEQLSLSAPTPSGAMLSAVLAMHDAETANSSPVLRPSTAADNKPALTPSNSVASIGSKFAKSPLPDAHTTGKDENCAPVNLNTSDSTDELFHTPLVSIGSSASLKCIQSVPSSFSQSVCGRQNTLEEAQVEDTGPLQVHQGRIEPLGVPVPSTYADAANLASQHPEVADDILALPLSPKKAPGDAVERSNRDIGTTDEDEMSVCAGPSKAPEEAHSPSKPNWALAPDPSPKGSSNGKGSRRPRSGKTKEPVRDSDLRRRRSRGTGQSRRDSSGRDKEPGTNNPSPSADKSKGNMRNSGPSNNTRQTRAQSTSNARGSRDGTSPRHGPSKNKVATQGSDPRSALHLAQVNALIKQLQKPLLEAGQTSERSTSSKRKEAPTRASSVPPMSLPSPPANASPGQWVWIAGHDGVLRPDLGNSGNSSRLPPRSASPPTFVPAGMQFASSQAFQRQLAAQFVAQFGAPRPVRRDSEPLLHLASPTGDHTGNPFLSMQTTSEPGYFLGQPLQRNYGTPPHLEQSMQRNDDSRPLSAPGSSRRRGVDLRGSPVSRPSKTTNSASPSTSHRGSATPDGRGMMDRRAGRGRTPNSQGAARPKEDGTRTWRSAKLSKNPSPAATRGPSPSPAMPSAADFGQPRSWPTLDEICDAMEASSAI